MKTTRMLAILVLALGLVSVSLAAESTWATRADMPTVRGCHSASVVDGRIYVIGGSPSYPWAPIRALDVYEPATDTWTRKADIPGPRYGGSTSVVDGKIYVFGGYVGRRRVDKYDPVTDTWIRKAEMPTYRVGLSTSVLDGKIYAIGGHPGFSPYPGITTVDVYDPATDTWTTAPDMPTGRFCPRTSVVDGKIYVIGGMGYWIGTAYGTVEEYDPNPLVVDFNGDEIVDIDDLLILIEHWGTDEPLCDIAPRPFGDGVVDVQDLEVLMSYWQQEILPVSLLAYWKLDEAEGDIAYDIVGVYDGVLNGVPTWQPTGGAVDGALQFDGIDDYVSTPFVLNPADGAFSVFAWIKGGTPGQVIIFQTGYPDGMNWLLADPAEGKLMTKLLRSTGGRFAPPPLISEFVITDGDWHRIGFVWDGSYRTLYVDDVEVATYTQGSFAYSSGGLYVGAGKGLEAGSFWSGLIDDVRIYNRAIAP